MQTTTNEVTTTDTKKAEIVARMVEDLAPTGSEGLYAFVFSKMIENKMPHEVAELVRKAYSL